MNLSEQYPMTYKEKIRAEIEKRYRENKADGYSDVCEELWDILSFIDSLQQEPVSEELEEAAHQYYEPNDKFMDGFKKGAKWQKSNLWKPADGDDLPEYDREVIAILDYDFGHYKVVYAHRPFPDGWDGTNIDTGEKEHFEPAIYDKGGWNQPHILHWLDAKLPYEEKIDKEIEL